MNNTLKTAIQVLTRFSFRSEGEGEGEPRNLLAFLPKRAFQDSAVRKQVVELSIKGLSYRRTVAICHRKDAYLSPAARRLIEILKKTASDINKR